MKSFHAISKVLAITITLLSAGTASSSTPEEFQLMLEVISFDCEAAGADRETCEDALSSSLVITQEVSRLKDRFASKVLISLPGTISTDTLFAGAGCMEGLQLAGDFSMHATSDGRYLIDVQYDFSETVVPGEVDELSGTTQVLIRPGEGPHMVGASLSDISDPARNPRERTVTLTVVLLSVAVDGLYQSAS